MSYSSHHGKTLDQYSMGAASRGAKYEIGKNVQAIIGSLESLLTAAVFGDACLTFSGLYGFCDTVHRKVEFFKVLGRCG